MAKDTGGKTDDSAPVEDKAATKSVPTDDKHAKKPTNDSATDQTKSKDPAATKSAPTTTSTATSNKLPVVCLIIALIALAGCGILFIQQQQLQQKLANQHVDLTGYATVPSVTAIKEQQQQQQVRIYEHIAVVEAQAKLLNEKLLLPTQNIVRLEQEIDRLKNDVAITKGQLSHLPSNYSEAELQWLLARCMFLIETAADQLTINANTQSAVAALSAAESLLRNANHPAFLPLRESLRKDIQVVAAVPLPDSNKLIAQLDALINTTTGLGIEEVPTNWPLKASGGDDLASAAESAGQKVLNAMRGVIDIRRGKRGQALLLGPDEHYILVQNIAIRLETAKAAVLTRNTLVYQNTLQHIDTWIRSYFNEDDAQVKQALAEILELKKHDLTPPLPSLTQSEQTLITTRQALEQHNSEQGG